MKLLLFFRGRLNRANTLTARLSKSSYTVYILHPFFVVVATRLARDLPPPASGDCTAYLPPGPCYCLRLLQPHPPGPAPEQSTMRNSGTDYEII